MSLNNQNQHALFVGSYGPAEQPGIFGMRFDAANGRLTVESRYAGVINPSFLTVHPNGRWLYAVSEIGVGSHGAAGAVCAFRIESETLQLEPLNRRSSEGDWPCHIALDRSGRWLIASNYGSGDAVLYPILEDGRLGERTAFVRHSGQGPNAARQEGPHAHSASFTPDNRFVLVADLGIDRVVIYAFDAEAGSLTETDTLASAAGAGPRHMTWHPNGTALYVANELDSTVTPFFYDSDSGRFKERETLPTLPDDGPESTVADIHLSPAADRLFISNRGHNSIAVFDVDGSGTLSGSGIYSCGGNWPRNFAVGPHGRCLLVANRRSNEITLLALGNDGELEKRRSYSDFVVEPSCIRFL